eukprot:694786-Pleurochrysis_carterae.AAC.1
MQKQIARKLRIAETRAPARQIKSGSSIERELHQSRYSPQDVAFANAVIFFAGYYDIRFWDGVSSVGEEKNAFEGNAAACENVRSR